MLGDDILLHLSWSAATMRRRCCRKRHGGAVRRHARCFPHRTSATRSGRPSDGVRVPFAAKVVSIAVFLIAVVVV